MRVKWEVEVHKDFDPEFDALPDDDIAKADQRFDEHLSRTNKKAT